MNNKELLYTVCYTFFALVGLVFLVLATASERETVDTDCLGVHLKELYEGTEVNKNSIRAILNISVAKGEHFERLGGGYYKLKDETNNNA